MSELSRRIEGIGPENARLAIIGIAPGDEELKAGRPFVGPSGNILRRDLRDAGYELDNCYITNVFKHKLPNNEFKKFQEIGLNLEEAMADLRNEINAINPNCILGLGEPVLYSLVGKSGKNNGINVWRGSILQSMGHKAVFTWHPAAELHGAGEGQWKSWQKYVRKFDIKRAVEQSEFKEFRLPQRLLHIAQSSADVYRFLERHKDSPYCALDIEAIEGIPVCIGLSFNSVEGFCVPLWGTLPIKYDKEHKTKKNYNLKISTIPVGDLAYIWKFLADFLANPNFKFIGHNFKYDEDKINRLGFYLKLYWDTMLGAHCRSSEMPKGLAFNTSIDTFEPYYKFEGREFNPKVDKIEDFFLYNCKDACVTRELFDVQVKDLLEIDPELKSSKFRMECHTLYKHIDNVGFKEDALERKSQIHSNINTLIKLEVELKSLVAPYGITEAINVASHPQVNDLLYKTLKIPQRDGAGEQVITQLLGNIVKKPDQIRILEIILDWRRYNKTLGYLQAEPDYDARMKTNFKITGTENYRTSTNVLEPPIRPEQMGWAFQTISKHGDIGNNIRSILVADPKYVIVNIDKSQAEARVCSLLANDEETLLSYDNQDKHALTAAKFFGGKEENYSKKVLGYECPERFVGKTLRHAYHLGITKREAMINVNTDARKYKIPIRISEWRAGECLKVLASDTPKIQTVFHYTIQELLRRNRRIYGTYGASRYFFDEMDTRDLWKGAYAFIPQQTVSDSTKKAGLQVLKNLWHIKIVCESHDALTFLIPDRQALYDDVAEIKSYFLEPIDFSGCSIARRSLVIPCDVEIGVDYCNLEKFRRERVA